jgi:chemotaxis protein methyltransferase CheR
MAFTYFFRDLQILEQITNHVVPYVSGRSRIKVWDAGCAMGPEPYSLAIMFAESMGKFAYKNLRIVATDIDNCFGDIIAKGIYPEEEVKRIPAEIFQKYFRPNGKPGYFEISQEMRDHLVFQKHDLLTLQPLGQDFSMVMCKNVLLHFQQSERIEVLKMFHASLAEGGYFASEQTQKMPAELGHLFEQVSGNGQIYKKVG